MHIKFNLKSRNSGTDTSDRFKINKMAPYAEWKLNFAKMENIPPPSRVEFKNFKIWRINVAINIIPRMSSSAGENLKIYV